MVVLFAGRWPMSSLCGKYLARLSVRPHKQDSVRASKSVTITFKHKLLFSWPWSWSQSTHHHSAVLIFCRFFSTTLFWINDALVFSQSRTCLLSSNWNPIYFFWHFFKVSFFRMPCWMSMRRRTCCRRPSWLTQPIKRLKNFSIKPNSTRARLR